MNDEKLNTKDKPLDDVDEAIIKRLGQIGPILDDAFEESEEERKSRDKIASDQQDLLRGDFTNPDKANPPVA